MVKFPIRNAKGEVLFHSSWYRPPCYRAELYWPPAMVAIRNAKGKVLFHSLHYRPRHHDIAKRSKGQQEAFLRWQADEYGRWLKARDEARKAAMREAA